MDRLVQSIVDLLSNFLSKEATVGIISMMPILELRGGLIASALFKIPYLKAALICVIGNILPIPFVLLFLKKVFSIMEKWGPTKKIVSWLNEKATKNKAKIDKYGFWGLVLFVGIPLPGTGAWTGSLVASVFEMDIKKSSIAILIGILIAFIIMSIVSYGVIHNIVY